MGELAGEFAHVLQPALSRVFGHFLANNPFFQAYEWQIVAAVIGIPILWMFASAYLKRNPQAQSRKRSELSTEFASFYGTLWGWIRRNGLALPSGLRIPLVFSVIGAALAAFADLPYDFFVLLRVLIFITCGVVLVSLWRAAEVGTWFWIMAGIAIIYNPLLPIHLHKDTWAWINVATVLALTALCILIGARKSSPVS